MGRESGDSNANSEFAFDPTGKVIGVIDDAGDVKAALGDLAAAGFAADEVEVLTGEGAQADALAGEEQSAVIRIVPPNPEPPGFYDAPGFVEQIKKHLSAGRLCVAVAANKQEARDRAHEVLKVHRGHFINFHGRWAVEQLEP